jgi:hypothetical protein
MRVEWHRHASSVQEEIDLFEEMVESARLPNDKRRRSKLEKDLRLCVSLSDKRNHQVSESGKGVR